MMLRDNLGNTTTGATRESLEHYEHALRLFQCYIGDPVAVVDTARMLRDGIARALSERASVSSRAA